MKIKTFRAVSFIINISPILLIIVNTIAVMLLNSNNIMNKHYQFLKLFSITSLVLSITLFIVYFVLRIIVIYKIKRKKIIFDLIIILFFYIFNLVITSVNFNFIIHNNKNHHLLINLNYSSIILLSISIILSLFTIVYNVILTIKIMKAISMQNLLLEKSGLDFKIFNNYKKDKFKIKNIKKERKFNIFLYWEFLFKKIKAKKNIKKTWINLIYDKVEIKKLNREKNHFYE